MQEAALPLLAPWANFYVIIGTAAATRTGLTFVVITLLAGLPRRISTDGIAAFNTPSVVHFCATLFITTLLSAPWPLLWPAALLLGLTGLSGITYVILIVRRTRHISGYQPVLEDWLWHVVFPFLSYLALIIAAIAFPSNPASALFVIAAATLLFLFIGIHNSWDNVTYLITLKLQSEDKSEV